MVNRKALRGSGGVGILIHNRLSQHYRHEVLDQSVEGILWVKLTSRMNSEVSIVICSCYLPPIDSSRSVNGEQYFEELLCQCHKYQNEGIILIGGDFNARCAELSEYIEGVDKVPTRSAIDLTVNRYGELLMDFMISTNTCMLNGRIGQNNFTSVSNKGKAVVDYCIVPYEQLGHVSDFTIKTMTDLINEFNMVMPLLTKMSDHSILLSTIDSSVLNLGLSENNADNDQYLRKTKRFDVKKISSDFMNSDQCQAGIKSTIQHIEQSLKIDKDINSACNELIILIQEEMKAHLNEIKDRGKPKNHKLKQKPWWDDRMQTLWNNVCDSEHLYLSCKGKGNKRQELKNNFIQTRKLFDRESRKVKRKHQREQLEELKHLAEHDNVGFWKQINKLSIGSERSNKIPLAVEIDGEVVSDLNVVMEKWRADFSSLFSAPNSPNSPNFDTHNLKMVEDRLKQIDTLRNTLTPSNEPDNHPLNVPLTYMEVEKAINKLKNNKATGSDGIPAECLKNKTVIDILFKIYAHCFNTGTVPDIWLQGVINPIFKAGSKYEPLNYRGITLINVICKCYSNILNKRLCDWLENNDLLNDEQNGFRQARSCLDHMYVLYTIVKNRLLLKCSTFTCFIDAKKAFDRVSHPCLWFKLVNIGINGKMLGAIRSLYDTKHLNCSVCIDKYVTKSFPVECGVKQGDPMSPTLFAIYVNDLIVDLNAVNQGVRCGNNSVSCLFYADDIVIMSETASGLQTQLNVVSNWCNKWRMELNQQKTNVIHFHPKSISRTNCNFKCGDHVIDKVSKYKYLGLYFNEHMDETQIVNDVVKSATRSLSYVISKYKNSGGLLYQSFNILYESCVQPVMLYGAALWGFKEHSKLNSVQNRACRFFLGVPKTASTLACRGDMGWLSVHAKQKREMIRYWCRLNVMDQSRLTYRIFKWSNSVSLSNIKTWEYNVKKLLKEANMLHITERENDINVKSFMNKFNDNIVQQDKENWFQGIWNDNKNEQNGNKLRLYRCFKEDIFVENYVTCIMPFHHRQQLSRLRLGCLPIEIEMGRRFNVPLCERTCKMCTTNCIEDEIHLLLECPMYNDLREKIISSIEDRNLDFKNQYYSLLSNTNIQADLAKCIFNIMRRRDLFCKMTEQIFINVK